jgi:hypothetical protein
MSRKEAVRLASRTLAVLMTVWALTEVSYLPSAVYSFLRYGSDQSTMSYWRHHYLIQLGFVVTRMIGYSLTALWLFKGGPEIEELLLPESEEQTVQS